MLVRNLAAVRIGFECYDAAVRMYLFQNDDKQEAYDALTDDANSLSW